MLKFGIMPGPAANLKKGKHQIGVFCEGRKRIGCCQNYMTHIVGDTAKPYMMWSVLTSLSFDVTCKHAHVSRDASRSFAMKVNP